MAEGLLGGMDGIDPAEIQKWMAQFGANEQDRKDANKQAMFALGFGLLGGRKGNELATIGQAGLGAMNAQQSYLQNATKERGANIAQALSAIKMSKDVATTNMGLRMLGGEQQPMPAAPSFGMNDRGTGMALPTSAGPVAASSIAPGATGQPGGAAPWANPRNELAFSVMGKKDIADVIHRQYKIEQGPSGTLMRNGQIVGQVIPNAGMVIDGQFQALPKEATEALANYQGTQTKATEAAKSEFDLVPVPVGNGQTKLMPKSQYLASQQPPPSSIAPPTMNFQGSPEFVAKAKQIAAADFSGQQPLEQQRTPAGGMGGYGVTPSPVAMKAAEGRVSAQTAQDTKINENFAQTYNDALNAEYQAPAKIAKLNQLRTYLSQVETGKLAPTAINLKSFAAYVAPDLAKDWTKDVPYAQAAQQLSNEMALQLRNPAGGGGMPGALSDADREFLTKLIPTIGNDPRSLSMATDAKIALAKREQELGKLAREYRKVHGTIDEGFYGVAQSFADSHPLFAGVAPAAAPSGGGAKTIKFGDLPR